jgi:cytochrome P450
VSGSEAQSPGFLSNTGAEMLDVYGSNVGTAGWSDWQRQRKIVAAPFNESTNKLVWSESLSQARDMLSLWTRPGGTGTLGLAQDTRTLSLDVLAATGFRRSYQFRASSEPSVDKARDYRDALKIVLDNALLLMIAPPRLLSLPILPKSWARIGQATIDFRQYMMDMLDEETSLLSQGKPGTGSLMTSFVKALGDNQRNEIDIKHDAVGPNIKGLTLSEILGNIFVINFAGHDTTANTLAFGMLLLATYPEVQSWVAEELQEIISDGRSETWDYDALFPRLKRCQAVLVSSSSSS